MGVDGSHTVSPAKFWEKLSVLLLGKLKLVLAEWRSMIWTRNWKQHKIEKNKCQVYSFVKYQMPSYHDVIPGYLFTEFLTISFSKEIEKSTREVVCVSVGVT